MAAIECLALKSPKLLWNVFLPLKWVIRIEGVTLWKASVAKVIGQRYNDTEQCGRGFPLDSNTPNRNSLLFTPLPNMWPQVRIISLCLGLPTFARDYWCFIFLLFCHHRHMSWSCAPHALGTAQEMEFYCFYAIQQITISRSYETGCSAQNMGGEE